MSKLKTIGLDADDTLWHNEQFFRLTQQRFAELLNDHADQQALIDRLEAAERRNLGHYGFGVKGFVLSMIETAVEVGGDQVPASVINELLESGREMLRHPIELLPGVAETVAELAESHALVLITKGDLLDQERKLAQSGLGEMFRAVEIVSDKTPDIYARAFAGFDGGVEGAMMVGNSLKSDVLPALEAGAWGVHVPHELTWSFEAATPPVDHDRFHVVPGLPDLAPLVQRLS
ncbi:HAD family hydrolase [Actibacterium mucosum KCTC 23349]|uniref:HAD family hydrolase n=1 Tax=Actibacterium mucosum KCTC 23349 TaxID=1454373 RepID=A0A037ZGZ4_9RHOB|nr:HAD family hydrolase [Actibacterium mucosum]KAJ54874.1 HAD family hydrolase [Actibacterium mucosum KCTC 23349]